MGFPYGADEDAAFIIAWLELNNFKGVTLLKSLIPDLNQKYEGDIKINNLKEVIDFKNSSILITPSYCWSIDLISLCNIFIALK